MTTYSHCVKWLPLDHPFYKSCVFVNFGEQDSVSFTDVENVISSFDSLHAKFIEDPSVSNTIEEEFMDYLFFAEEQISSDIQKKAEMSDRSYQMDIVQDFLRIALPNLQIAMVVLQ